MNRPDTPVAAPGAIVRHADHADRKYIGDISDCDATITSRTGLEYIVHLTSGIWDFSVHSPAHRGRSETFDQAARQLSLIVDRIDTTADQLDSGPLIRVVVHGNRGALFHMLKVTGQTFFGMSLDGTPQVVEQADRDLARIAEKSAARVGSPSLLWGAFDKRSDSGDISLPGATQPPDEYPEDSATAVGRHLVTGEVRHRCLRVLDTNDVHFVGIYQHHRLVWRADLFTDPALASFFQRVTPAMRRRGYDKVIRQVTMQLGRIMQLLALVGSDLLTRLVLDVARGAIYVLPLGDREYYLVGVTLIQPRVSKADKKMAALHHDLLATSFRPGGS
jgi:hypothetical protein